MRKRYGKRRGQTGRRRNTRTTKRGMRRQPRPGKIGFRL